MNKCHFYLSSGLWEIVKCIFENDSNLFDTYFWGMAVAPNHTCFASHLITTPWHQSWTTLNLLEECHKRETEWKTDIFNLEDVENAKAEVDVQFTLRNYAEDLFVNRFFTLLGSLIEERKGFSFDEDITCKLEELLHCLYNSSPSTAFCFGRQLAPQLSLLFSERQNAQLLPLFLACFDNPPAYNAVQSFHCSKKQSICQILLIVKKHYHIIKELEKHEKNTAIGFVSDKNSCLLSPAVLFRVMLLTNRHFIFHLIDCLDVNNLSSQFDSISKFLWPLFLIRQWNVLEAFESILQPLIDKCKECVQDKVLLQGYFMLEWYLKFSQWSDSQGREEKVTLEAARDRSVLRLICSSGDLSQFDWSQVRALLREPWNYLLFDGYCSLMLVLQAMVDAATLRPPLSSVADAAQAEIRYNSAYRELITDRLNQVRTMIERMQPLPLRLEVLENIFALLFVTWENIENVRVRCSEGPTPRSSPSKGFVCTPHVLRDVVYLIKQCNEELEREPRTAEENRIPCSIRPSQMENRLDRLTESVSEATWRMQLITDADLASSIDTVHICYERNTFEGEWLVETCHETGKVKRRSVHEKREESGSQSPASGGEAERGIEKHSGPAFMHQMLSSDWSLVVRCLSQNDLLNAEHIITMMSTEESRQVLENELNYTQAINDLRKKLHCLGESPVRKPSMSFSTSPNRKSGSLQAVQQAAAQAVTATALTSHVERFLSTITLPIVPGTSKLSLGSMLQCMENGAAIATIDLALTASISFPEFRDLLMLAGKHCPELTSRLQSPLNSSSCSKPLGYIAFAQILVTLLQDINKETHMSPGMFLRNRHAPFSLKTLKEQETLWKQLKSLAAELGRTRRNSEAVGKDNVKGQKNIKAVQKVLENVVKVVENASEILDLGRNETSATDLSKTVNYSELLNRYLSDLAALCLDFVPNKQENEDIVTLHSLLDVSAVEVLDRLIFQHHVDPGLLEKKAQQLGFNLCANLVWGCCPPCPQGPALPSSFLHPIPHCLVLNACISDDVSVFENLDAVVEVSSILQGLLDALKLFAAFTTPDCDNIIEFDKFAAAAARPDVEGLLARTSNLGHGSLSPMDQEQSFVFYCNLFNLISLHSVLHTAARELLCNADKMSREVSQWFVGYDVTHLGFISLGELGSAILGNNFWPSPFTISGRQLHLKSDSRAVFLLPMLQLNGRGPRYRTLCVEFLNETIEEAISSFIVNNVSYCATNIRISSYLLQYLDNGAPEHSVNKLLDFVAVNCKNEQFLAAMQKWSTTELTIETTCEVNEKPKILLDYCEHGHSADSWPENLVEEHALKRWKTRQLTAHILKVLSENSRVLADVVARLHEARESSTDQRGLEVGRDVLLDERLRYIEALLAAPWIEELTCVFDANQVLAALNKLPNHVVLWTYLNKCISERMWQKCMTLLMALPDFALHNDPNLRRLRDLVLFELASYNSQLESEQAGWIWAHQITDFHLRLQCILANSQFWPGSVASKQLSAIIKDDPPFSDVTLKEIDFTLKKINVFHSIGEKCDKFAGQSWFEVASLSETAPNVILHNLLSTHQLELCLEWLNLPTTLDSILPYVDVELVKTLACKIPLHVAPLLLRLPVERILQLCEQVIPLLKSLSALKAIAELCIEVNSDPTQLERYEKLLLGVRLIELLDDDDKGQMISLVTEPLLMIEQLILNTKLEILQTILTRLKWLPKLVPEKSINDLLTHYASRAVELDLVRVEVPSNFHISSTAGSDFVIPSEVPDKSQWVADNQVSVCMCCSLISFSMFNRRHHCRRCGRVVCASCSTHRIKVNGYQGVAVRVCQTCYAEQAKPEVPVSVTTLDRSSSSNNFHQWRLSLDETRNMTVREEFSFQHTPNPSLCLAIFNLLPPSPCYIRILLDESDRLLQILQCRDAACNPEIDHAVLIQIIRTLVVGAKVRYGQIGLSMGVENCDSTLSQVYVLSLLVKNNSTHLITPEPLSGKSVRLLRDRLVEEELWDLAIEVSTKEGLPLPGVWAAWGKTLLAAGCWSKARVKFAQCLTPAGQSARSSPLLDEICQIIESTSLSNFNPAGTSHEAEVLEILSSLKGLATGKLTLSSAGGPGSPQYLEQEWYLTRYGNATSLLRFYLRYDQWEDALSHLLQRQLDPLVFLESILLYAYKGNQQDKLKSAMLSSDPSLGTFMRYLTSGCKQLQKNFQLHTLRDIQEFMQDYIRAAMTSIQLYQSDAENFSQLLEAADILQAAYQYLEDEIKFEGKKTRCVGVVMQLQTKDINRHMNTICRQLEISKYLANCENSGRALEPYLAHVAWPHRIVPTLLGGQQAREIVAALCILAGKNVEEGFGFAFRIIENHELNPDNVYREVGEILVKLGRGSEIKHLVNCITTSGVDDVIMTVDRVISASIGAMTSANVQFNVSDLIPMINNVDLRITALIDCKELKHAYLLAVKHNRLTQVERILEVAIANGQSVIRDICRRKLGLESDTVSEASTLLSSSS